MSTEFGLLPGEEARLKNSLRPVTHGRHSAAVTPVGGHTWPGSIRLVEARTP